MQKNWLPYTSTLIAGLMLCTTVLIASEGRPAGQRISTQDERMESKEGRALFSKIYPHADNAQEESAYFEEAQTLSADELQAKVSEATSSNGMQDLQAGEASEGTLAKMGITAKSALSGTSHIGAYHVPYSVSPMGDYVFMEDGSGWNVRYSDTSKTLNWYTSDRLIITANHELFSSYDYRINNEVTGHTVAANLVTAPYYNGLYTHWIVGIDYVHKKICLEDGSIWSISVWDGVELNRMELEDTIIIGTNDSWFQASCPNILINVETMEYVKAHCQY